MKITKSFIVDARLGSKYVSGIGFTVIIYLIKSKSISKICHCVLVFKEEGVICSPIFGCCWQVKYIQTWIKHNKPKANNGLMLRCKLWAILAHWYNASIEYFVLRITFLTNKSVVMAFALFYGRCWWKILFLLMYSQFCYKIRLFLCEKLIKLMKDK